MFVPLLQNSTCVNITTLQELDYIDYSNIARERNSNTPLKFYKRHFKSTNLNNYDSRKVCMEERGWLASSYSFSVCHHSYNTSNSWSSYELYMYVQMMCIVNFVVCSMKHNWTVQCTKLYSYFLECHWPWWCVYTILVMQRSHPAFIVRRCVCVCDRESACTYLLMPNQ